MDTIRQRRAGTHSKNKYAAQDASPASLQRSLARAVHKEPSQTVLRSSHVHSPRCARGGTLDVLERIGRYSIEDEEEHSRCYPSCCCSHRLSRFCNPLWNRRSTRVNGGADSWRCSAVENRYPFNNILILPPRLRSGPWPTKRYAYWD